MVASAAAQDAIGRDLTAGLNERSPGAELFLRAYEVFSHPRCSNCHPRDDRPRWGPDRVHAMNVQRGADRRGEHEGGYGRTGMTCATCHQQTNGALPASPPGAKDWRLAPKRMGWVGLTATELCQQFKTLAQQGGAEIVDAVIDHIVKKIDPLVAWAWDPGPGREAPPGDVQQLATILTWWKNAGAPCP
jgi:hypothetical protein